MNVWALSQAFRLQYSSYINPIYVWESIFFHSLLLPKFLYWFEYGAVNESQDEGKEPVIIP